MNRKEILKLINLHHEGAYWDFKKKWHDDKVDLLHDIICMANNLENREAYIIIGIDEDNDFNINDIVNDPNRKNTQKVVDFLKDKDFAGGIRPSVHVETIDLDSKPVDIIVIENSDKTPFYLVKNYEKRLRANHIYTRVQDTNTPVDKSADINNVEYLWKKRFHLLCTPMDKFYYYLQDKKNWLESSDEHHLYYKPFPEYLIEFEEDDRNGYEYFHFAQCDRKPCWGLIRLKYMNVSLLEFSGMYLDGFRYMTIAPNRGFLNLFERNRINPGNPNFRFMIKGSLEYVIHEFYFRAPFNDYDAYRRYIESILIFDNQREYDSFKLYAEKNWFTLKYDEIMGTIPHIPQIENLIIETYEEEWKNFYKLKYLLEKYRNHIN